MERQMVSDPLIDDVCYARKNLEKNRRIQRLQQVRVEANNIAKTVRNNVEKEKQKCLKEIEMTKAKEYENWRSQIHNKLHQDCNNTVFQIGAAHLAALSENNKKPKIKSTSPSKTKTIIKKKINSNRIHSEKENRQMPVSNACPLPERKRKAPTKNTKNYLKKHSGQKEKLNIKVATNNKADRSSNAVCENCENNNRDKCKKPLPIVIEMKNDDDSIATTSAITEEKIDHNRVVHKSPKKTRRPRYTQISDFVKKTSSIPSDGKNCLEIISEKNGKSNEVNNANNANSRIIVTKFQERIEPSLSSSSSKVQFYDYNNKFIKEYDQPEKIVNVNKKSCDHAEENAMELALSDIQLRSGRELEAEKLRLKSDERCQKALEREQVQRDYNQLTEKLDALMSQGYTMAVDEHKFSNQHQKNLATQRESHLNQAFEKILQRPAIITCPDISKETKNEKNTNLPQIKCTMMNDGLNVAATDSNTKESQLNLNTSDSSSSCRSILLNYANEQSKLISNDIEKMDTKLNSAEEDKIKVEKLQNLFKRIEQLRERLVKELQEKKTVMGSDEKEKIQTMLKSINDLSTERTNILTKNSDVGGSRVINKNVEEIKINERDEDSYVRDGTNKPFEIIIKVQAPRNARKRLGIVSTLVRSPVKKKHPNTNKKSLNGSKFNKRNPRFTHPTTESFSNNLTISTSTSYCSLPPTLANNIDAVVRDINQEPSKQITSDRTKNKTKVKNVNPLLAHYVQRLLGMSRNSINALEIASSEIDTPSSSIMNATGNISTSESDNSKVERMDRVQNFIDDSYNFLSDLEESIKVSNASVTETVTKMWKQYLKPPANKIDKHVQCSSNDDKPLKPILKKVACKRTASGTSTETGQTEPEKTTTSPTTNQITRYGQLSNNCSSRIAELSELINKIREEKQKLLEVTLSSESDIGKNSTEYMDLPKTIQPTTTQERRSMCSGKNPNVVDGNNTSECGNSLELPPPQSTKKLSNHNPPPVSLFNFGSDLLTSKVNLPQHQLSTILEVETPGASQANCLVQSMQSFATLNGNLNESSHARNSLPNIQYNEFPSIKSYLNKSLENLNSKLDTADSIGSLLLTHLTIKDFPSINTYLAERELSTSNLIPLTTSSDSQRQSVRHTPKPNKQNTSSSHAMDSSDSFNIEEELLRRKILKKGFRRNTENQKEFSHNPPTRDQSQNNKHISSNSSCLSSEIQKSDNGCNDNEIGEIFKMFNKEEGETLNLRDFLTKELLKRTNTSSSTSSNDDNSLTSVFLRSVLESMTNGQKASQSNKNGAQSLERYKTSTPLVSFSSQSRSSSSPLFTHLFSGESCISSVHSNAPSKD